MQKGHGLGDRHTKIREAVKSIDLKGGDRLMLTRSLGSIFVHPLTF